MVEALSITKDLSQETTTDAIRRFVGRGKRFSVSEFAEATGIDERTINSYRNGESEPCAYKLKRIMAALGADFLNAWLSDTGMGGAFQVEQKAVEPALAALKFDDLSNEIMHRIHDDNVFCHRDKAEMADRLIESGAEMVSTGHRWKQDRMQTVPIPIVGTAS